MKPQPGSRVVAAEPGERAPIEKTLSLESHRSGVRRLLQTLACLPARVAIALWAAAYSILFFAASRLRFPIRLDELHFWPTSILFSRHVVPPVELLRNYGELNTPLPFIFFGAIEHVFHGGIAAGRTFNLLLSFGIISLILSERNDRQSANLTALGLAFFPYYLGLSIQLYTDIIAAFCVVVATWLHVRARYVSAGIAFALAIASRQYMVAFPIAFATWEITMPSSRWSDKPVRWMAPAFAAATFGLWVWLFGGPAPQMALTAQGIPADRLTDLAPSHLIFLLSCVGLFFVCVETLLFRGWSGARLSKRQVIATIAATLLLAIVFPPLGSTRYGVAYAYLGVMDHTLATVLPAYARVLLYAVLASLAIMRFAPSSLPGLLMWSYGMALVSGHMMWEKYALPLLAVLWYLKAREPASRSVGN